MITCWCHPPLSPRRRGHRDPSEGGPCALTHACLTRPRPTTIRRPAGDCPSVRISSGSGSRPRSCAVEPPPATQCAGPGPDLRPRRRADHPDPVAAGAGAGVRVRRLVPTPRAPGGAGHLGPGHGLTAEDDGPVDAFLRLACLSYTEPYVAGRAVELLRADPSLATANAATMATCGEPAACGPARPRSRGGRARRPGRTAGRRCCTSATRGWVSVTPSPPRRCCSMPAPTRTPGSCGSGSPRRSPP